MLYQNILTDISPYKAMVGRLDAFGEHRHADIELHYSLEGSFDVFVHKKIHHVEEGQLLLINPMVAHSFPDHKEKDRKILTVIVGVSFLKKFFTYFSGAGRDVFIVGAENAPSLFRALLPLLHETAELCQFKTEKNDLLIRGNLYKICSYLIDLVADPNAPVGSENKELIKVANIEKALEMIYYGHTGPLTVEDAARATGYGKSNFCKIFKSITGDTFHNVLNHHRIESARALLAQTDLSISQIATEVGFSEAKTFCRVFKSLTSQTPGQYRKSNRQ